MAAMRSCSMESGFGNTNAENYAAANFEAARQSIELGSVFKNTNLPRGHVFEDWTML